MADPMTLAQGPAEALAEDEALRGDLTDDGFGPLLEWATNTLIATATTAATLPEAEAARRMEAAGTAIKRLLRAAVQTAQGHAPSDLYALLREPLLVRDVAARARLAKVVARFGDDADANAKLLADALQDVHP